MKLQRRIENATQALRIFILTDWKIVNENFLEMNKMILPKDKEAFDFSRTVHDTEAFYKIQIRGARKYVMKEPDESIEASIKRYKKMMMADFILKTVFICGILYLIYSVFDIGGMIQSFWNTEESTRMHKI